jgi:cob(I)alamin adenosyltransferase
MEFGIRIIFSESDSVFCILYSVFYIPTDHKLLTTDHRPIMISEPSSKRRGLIQIFTGPGKGKTSAAVGSAVRAAGAGLRVAIVSFDKGGEHYSERKALVRFADLIDQFHTGLDRFVPETDEFRFGVEDPDREEARRGLAIVRELFERNEHDLLVLDEINTTIHLGMLDEREAAELLLSKPESLEIILTGRNCPDAYKEIADLVSEIRDVKHYLRNGIGAREGFDY